MTTTTKTGTHYKVKSKDPRRLLKHRKKNCECCICYRELAKLPPVETQEEAMASYKFEEREMNRAMKHAKRQVKQGKQATIKNFFKPSDTL
jgi:hypothetical protein